MENLPVKLHNLCGMGCFKALHAGFFMPENYLNEKII